MLPAGKQYAPIVRSARVANKWQALGGYKCIMCRTYLYWDQLCS